MTFAEALPETPDGSVDLMHIDGFHTYEAVSEDFHAWLPKLAMGGVMLFHDVAETTGYGSAYFWSELREKYPGFHFTHSWGLGVLFPPLLELLLAADGVATGVLPPPLLRIPLFDRRFQLVQ